ncbi:immunoglobulin-like domain-containing protein [Paenibacillus bouchesdurhonensis]|uniref:immunoglobulin-like domain-containing protein n=1 Tax=Paenibacillus bouchesdurhonensis TaxID=1870990 RepID=UPI000DA6140A|nr:immunoglobulin-like domain-containing protein [Paenibacillus bouchesdurhonensis]
MTRKGVVSLFLSLLMIWMSLPGLSPRAASAADLSSSGTGDKLILHYDMKNVLGSTVVNSVTSSVYDGEWINQQQAQLVQEADYGYIDFAGGTAAQSYISIPEGVLNGLTDVTVSALVNWKGNQAAEWLFALGQDSSKYLYFTPKYNSDSSARFGIATDGWRNEVSARTGTLMANDWKLVTVVMSGTDGTLTLYMDGMQAAVGSTNGMTLADLNPVGGVSGFIGKSFYADTADDPYFGGKIADFRIYNEALSASEIAQLNAEAAAKILLIEGTQPSPSANAQKILHYDMKTTRTSGSETILKDVSGNTVSFDGLFRNPQNGQLVFNQKAGFVAFDGGSATSNSGYIEIPKGSDGSDLLSGLDAVTLSALVNWDDDGANRWIFGLGTVTDDAEYGNKYFFATPRHGSDNTAGTGISKAGWRNEALVKGAPPLQAGAWKLVTTVYSEAADTLTLYVDGVKVTSGSAKGIKLAEIIDPSAAFSGFIGKSIFKADGFYKGRVSDFQVYKGALTDQEVADLYAEAVSNISEVHQLVIEDAHASLKVADYLGAGDTSIDAITKDLTLSATGKHGVNISWSSDHPGVIAPNGAVTRPSIHAGDQVVQLTAELSYEGLTAQKAFTVKVLQEFTDAQKAALDADQLEIFNVQNIKGNIRLSTEGEHGSTVTWVSSHPQVVKGTAEAVAAGDLTQLGRVARPAVDTAVTLTATVGQGGETATRIFNLIVKRDPGALDYDAYFFSYFTGEYEGGEEISFATAEDPLMWRSLNNGQSILQSTMGEKGLRDPFVIRSPEGDKFYMLATDLKMGESTNFDQAQITGSHYMMVWESDDLVNWSEQRMVEVAPKKGGNTWAPEAFYDKNTGDYVVFWASSMKVEDTYGKYPNGRPAGQYNVMYYATTRDFHTFSEPKVFIDEGFPTIDTTFIEHNDMLYRFTKSEIGYKVYYEKAPQIFYDRDGIGPELNGYQYEPIAGTRSGNQGLIGHAGNNEGQTVFKDIHEDKWYLFLDSWPYHVRVSTNLEDGTQFKENLLPSSAYALPPGPRHGTVIPITRAEYDALQAAYGVAGPAPAIQPVVHYTFDPADIVGTTVKDVSGNGRDAQLVGGAAVVTQDAVGGMGGAIELDGRTGYVQLPDNLIQDLNLQQATFSTWVKADKNQANQRIFDFSSETGRAVNRNTMYLSTQGDSGNLEFAIITPFTEKFANESAVLGANYKYAVKASRMDAGVWQHVALTIEDFDAVLYVNGVEAARSSTYNVEPRMLLETTMNYIGKSRNGAHPLFDGRFDDFRIYNRALTADEIVALADEVVDDPSEQPSNAEKILHYDMHHIEGTVVKDQTGRFDGTWVNSQQAEWLHTAEAGTLSFTGGSTSSYIEIPQGVLTGLTDITVSSLVHWKGAHSAEWIFALGQDSNKYLFVTPKRNSGDGSARLGLGITSWNNEAAANAATGSLEADEWKLVTAVMSETEGTLTLYIDGVEVAADSTRGYTLSQINNVGGSSGYVGKSFYEADPYYSGMIADFRVYDGALTAAEIKGLQGEAEAKAAYLRELTLQQSADRLDYAHFLNQNSSKDEITTSLAFPEKGEYGTIITWQSQNEALVTNQGEVIRPAHEAGNQSVNLIATLSNGAHSLTKMFTVTIVSKSSNAEALKADVEALQVHNINDVRGNLTLPTAGENGSTITWVSERPEIVTATGEVNRPTHGSGDATVKLTARITLNNEVMTKAFLAVVREMPVREDYTAYVFTYFTGEGKANGEQIYFALSEGNDPLRWRELNNGNPALISNLGEKGLRDPFIIRSPEGDKFYLIATDLRIYGNGDWHRSQTNGSRSIMVWESRDLINWSEQRMVEVSPPEAGNTWAPEIIYDRTTGEYVVFWASKLYDNEEQRKNGATHQRMVYAKTRDFYTFTKPEIYMDYGYSIIDTTMIEHDGQIYRFTKDERGNSASSPNGKYIFQEAGDTVFDPNYRLILEGLGKGMVGHTEGPTIFKSNTEEKWYLFLDEFAQRGYVPLETTDLASGIWTMPASYSLPSSPRHGTVIPITQSEYERIQQQVPGIEQPSMDIKVTGITLDQGNAVVAVGEQLQLSARITPVDAVNKTVAWSSSDEAIVVVNETGSITALKEGTAYVTVTTADGGYMAVSEIVVQADQASGHVPVTGVSLDRVKLTVTEGEQVQLNAAITPEQAANKAVVWSSSNDKVAAVDSTGKITALQVGTARIVVTTVDGGFTAQAEVSVVRRSSGGGNSGGGSSGSSSGGTSLPSKDSGKMPKPDAESEQIPGAAPGQTPGLTPEPGANPQSPAGNIPFKDVQSHWAAGSIQRLTEQQFMYGYPDGSFKPNQNMSRAEFMVVISRILGLEAAQGESAFADVRADAWYSKYLNAVHQQGIVKGFADGTLKPEQEITREEAFAILHRIGKFQLLAANSHSVDGAIELSFADQDQLSEWAKEAVSAFHESHILSGYPDGTIKPKNSITRAEIATILSKLLEL